MILSVDTETFSLNASAKHFIMAVLTYSDGRQETYYKKEDIWERILHISGKEAKYGRNTYLYFHSGGGEYDLYGICPNVDDPKLTYLGHNGIKATYELPKNKQLYLIDTYALFRQPLDDIGKLLGKRKLPMPKTLTEPTPRELDNVELAEIEKYCKKDSLLVILLLNRIKEELAKDGINPKKFITIGKISLSFLKKQIEESEDIAKIMHAKTSTNRQMSKGRKALQRIRRPKVTDLTQKKRSQENLLKRKLKEKTRSRAEQGKIKRLKEGIEFAEQEIKGLKKSDPHLAYRVGRLEALRRGKFQNVSLYDIRSNYPYCATRIPFPNLSSERTIENPLEIYDLENLLESIGSSRAIIETINDPIGAVPIRTPEGVYYPKEAGKILIGTYTHLDLKNYLKHGYKIHHIEQSTIYTTLENNPLKKLMKYYYKRRQQDKFCKALYKQLANNLFGKMAMRYKGYEYKVFEENNLPALKSDWKFLRRGKGLTRWYRKRKEPTPAEDYAPIVPAYINAYARQMIYEKAVQIERDDPKSILYFDTDGIMVIGNKDKYFDMTNKLGNWEKEMSRRDAEVIAEKHYRIGDKTAVSGTRKKGITKEAWESGRIPSVQIQTIRSAKSSRLIGKPKKIIKDLRKVRENREKKEETRGKNWWLTDHDEGDNKLSYEGLKTIRTLSKQRKQRLIKELST